MSFELIQSGLDISGVISIWLIGNWLLWEVIGKRIKISIESRETKTITIYGDRK